MTLSDAMGNFDDTSNEIFIDIAVTTGREWLCIVIPDSPPRTFEGRANE
jgi:hypothetical protein